MSYGLSKSRLMAFQQCPKRLWLSVYRRDLQEFSAETKQRFQIGFQVGDIARTLYPNGIFIDTADVAEALAWTRQAVIEYPNRPLFEAAFQRDNVLIRADVLLPEAGGYRLCEVKSSTSVKDEYYADCAIQAWVIGDSLKLTGVELAHVDKTFVYSGNGDYHGLLKPNALDENIADLLPQISGWIAKANTTLSDSEPTIAPGPQCNAPYSCPFQHYCIADQPKHEYPLHCLPRLRGKRWQGLVDLGIEDVRQIPDDYPLTNNQARVAQTIKSGQIQQNSAIARMMRAFDYPRYYLDFETMQVVVPIWPGTRPYQQLLVQWSCHCETTTGELIHEQFIANPLDDPRRALIEQLIKVLGDTGPVFVYNQGFEKTRLQELMVIYPELKAAIDAILVRMVDLMRITEKHYNHPAMKGSWSMKAVLPTIAPELAYDTLEISDGGAAMNAWQKIYHPDTTTECRTALSAALSKYCERDTLALVRLAAFLGTF